MVLRVELCTVLILHLTPVVFLESKVHVFDDISIQFFIVLLTFWEASWEILVKLETNEVE